MEGQSRSNSAEKNHDPEKEVSAYIEAAVRTGADELFVQTPGRFQYHSEPPESDSSAAGGITLSGGQMKGTFWVGVRAPEVERARGELYQDWVGELANQLAGRVKAQLLRVGLDCETKPPVVLRGEDLRAAVVGAKTALKYQSAEGSFNVWAVFEVIPPTELRPVSASELPHESGEFLLF